MRGALHETAAYIVELRASLGEEVNGGIQLGEVARLKAQVEQFVCDPNGDGGLDQLHMKGESYSRRVLISSPAQAVDRWHLAAISDVVTMQGRRCT